MKETQEQFKACVPNYKWEFKITAFSPRTGRRLPTIHTRSSFHASAINLWRGSKYERPYNPHNSADVGPWRRLVTIMN